MALGYQLGTGHRHRRLPREARAPVRALVSYEIAASKSRATRLLGGPPAPDRRLGRWSLVIAPGIMASEHRLLRRTQRRRGRTSHEAIELLPAPVPGRGFPGPGALPVDLVRRRRRDEGAGRLQRRAQAGRPGLAEEGGPCRDAMP